MLTVAFTTLGCKVNQVETDAIRGLFEQSGYLTVDFNQNADIYVINTCSVTHLGERKSRQLIRRAVRQNAQAVVLVTGCYAQISPDEVAKVEGVDVIIGTQERANIVQLAEAALLEKGTIKIVNDIMGADVFEEMPSFSSPERTRGFLKIQEGCTNFCSYCIIPYARGPLRSRALTSILSEAQKLVNSGFKEIVLTGIHLGAYGRDLSEDVSLVDAMRLVLSIPELFRLRISSLESVEATNDIINVMLEDNRVCPHLHLPLQAGDDSVLQAMNRNYTTADYKLLVENIRCKIPDIAITTDVIIGFPGETDTQFLNTVEFIKSMDFARVHVFSYSRRRGTPAFDYADQISENVKKHRVQILQKVVEAEVIRFQERFIGRELAVLFEHDDGLDSAGLTDNYIKVYVERNSSLVGQIFPVKLTNHYRDGVWGEIIG